MKSECLIRNAEEKDAEGVIRLLKQVLEIHAELRPDVFVSGTTKYSEAEVIEIFNFENRLSYVAVDETDSVIGYALCIIRENPKTEYMHPFRTLFIDDLCIDNDARGRHIGSELFEYVKKEAQKLGCYEISLNVWEGNIAAKSFYEKMGMKPKETQMEFIL